MDDIFSITKTQKFSKGKDAIVTIFRILMAMKMGSDKKRVMRKSQLTNEQLELYLEILLEKKLLVKRTNEKGRENYRVTLKGTQFVQDFYYSVVDGPFCPLCDYALDSRIKSKWLGLANEQVWHCGSCNKEYERPKHYLL